MQNYSYFVCFHNKLERISQIMDYFLFLFFQKQLQSNNLQIKKNSFNTHHMSAKIIK